MINKFWILALSLMVGGAITACGQDTAGGQAAVPAETAVEAVSASMDELSTEETAAEETAAEEATEKTPAEESSAEGTSMGDASIDGRTADETSLEGISGEAAQTDGTAVESAASVISAGTETAAAEVYTSREEAYKALLASLDPDEWEGAALIDFGGKQEPSSAESRSLLYLSPAAKAAAFLFSMTRGACRSMNWGNVIRPGWRRSVFCVIPLWKAAVIMTGSIRSVRPL